MHFVYDCLQVVSHDGFFFYKKTIVRLLLMGDRAIEFEQ